MKGIEVEKACMTCGRIDKLNKFNLKSEWMYTEDGEKYKIMYHICPQCKSKEAVQADNELTVGLKQRSIDILLNRRESGKKRQRGRSKSEKKYYELSKRLREEREKLEILLSGKTMYDKCGNIVVKHLTFPERSDIIESKM